jgi:hypothetical protein
MPKSWIFRASMPIVWGKLGAPGAEGGPPPRAGRIYTLRNRAPIRLVIPSGAKDQGGGGGEAGGKSRVPGECRDRARGRSLAGGGVARRRTGEATKP